MKKIKLISVFLCSVLLLTSCNSNDNIGESDTQTQTSEDTVEFKFDSFSVGKTDISEYRIVYAETDFEKISKGYRDIIYGLEGIDYDFDRLSAERIATLIKDNFGVSLEVVCDGDSEASGKEILVGQTNRKLHPESLDIDDYVVELIGDSLVICGGNYGSTWHAVDHIENMIAEAKENGDATPNFTDESGESATYELKRIACIGDSITIGQKCTGDKYEYFSYPANLQRILWRDYIVYNYGHGGKSMRDDLSQAYTKTEEYAACMANTEKYDAVLIMLGTNDSNLDHDWTDGDNKKFKSSAKRLVDALLEHSPDAKIIMMNCPAYYRVGGYHASDTVLSLQTETAEGLYAGGYPIYLYDMRSYSRKNMGELRFADQLHPNDEGYAIMSKGVAELVRAVFENAENKYLISLK